MNEAQSSPLTQDLLNKKGLAEMRAKFPDHQISLLPKPHKKDSPKGICSVCHKFHGLPASHLEYVGHAALTNRLLDVDPHWTWEPLAFAPDGLPLFDKGGGLWIRLTVCGVTRLGYGNAETSQYKEAGAREKEVIGDALRNAAMRFGAALDLWHKGDLNLNQDEPENENLKKKDAGPIATTTIKTKEPEKLKNHAPNSNSPIGVAKAADLISRVCKEGLWTREQVVAYIKTKYKKDVEAVSWKDATAFLELASQRTFEELTGGFLADEVKK